MTTTQKYQITRSVILGRTYYLLSTIDELIGKFSSQKAAYKFISINEKMEKAQA